MTAQTPRQGQVTHTSASQERDISVDVQRAGDALLSLAARDSLLANRLARLVQVVAAEAARTQRFARALSKALDEPPSATAFDHRNNPRRNNRRNRGVINPFAVFAEEGETGLCKRLAALNLEQLRDIIAEHGMDHDRLAMKWKDPQRVIDRIVDRVAARTTKGSAFKNRSIEAVTGNPPS